MMAKITLMFALFCSNYYHSYGQQLSEQSQGFLQQTKQEFDDRYHTFEEIALENGFQYEQFNITTEDGYILRLERIPPFNKTNSSDKSPVVLMQHGLDDSSIKWIINSPDKAPAFILSKAGFDVWLGNNRGNEFSQNHVQYNPKQKEFWDFDFEQMGLYDLPAFIDFILKKTNQTNVIDKLAAYIGHSEGTSQFFIGESMLPEYFQKNVNLFVALAPVVRLDHSSSKSMIYLSKYEKIIMKAIQFAKFYDIIQEKDITKFLLSSFCKEVPKFCDLFLENIRSFDKEVDNAAREGDRLGHSPAGSGWRNLDHFSQIINSKQFQRYDYGKDINLEKYGTETPPLYNLSQCGVKIGVFHGDLDPASNPIDIDWLLDESQSGFRSSELLVFKKEYHFLHESFQMAMDMSYVEDDMIPLILNQLSNYQQSIQE